MTLLVYKKAGLKYSVVESLTAGLELTGAEVKALRSKLGSMDGSRVIVRGGEAFIVGLTIPPYQQGNAPESYDPERPRRLLLKKAEIAYLADEESKKGLTIVPFELYNAGRYVKARINIVRGKGKSDKREDLKRKDAKREMDRALKVGKESRGRAKQ